MVDRVGVPVRYQPRASQLLIMTRTCVKEKMLYHSESNVATTGRELTGLLKVTQVEAGREVLRNEKAADRLALPAFHRKQGGMKHLNQCTIPFSKCPVIVARVHRK